MSKKKLYKSRKNKMIGGVCGGLAEYLNMDPTIVRIIGQLFIPAGTQDVLKPSIYVNNGTMPMAFTIYGILAYTIIAFMFLLVKDKISGSRAIRGLKYSISCCLVWVVYLLEPLPFLLLCIVLLIYVLCHIVLHRI